MTGQLHLFAAPSAPAVRARRRRVFVELFAGSASMSLALLDPKPPHLGTYLGGKRRWASAILPHLGLAPGAGSDLVVLNDLGTVSWAWAALADARTRASMVRWLLDQPDDEERLWRRLEALPVPDDPAERAATWLCLQAGSHLGKPARVTGDRWRTAGFARLSPSAVTRGFTARFKREILARRVQAIGAVLDRTEVRVSRLSAGEVEPFEGDDVVAYLDPPYLTAEGKRRTGYGPRPADGEVVATIGRWRRSALVGVSEGRPFDEAPGGTPYRVDADATDGRPRKSHTEFITVYPRFP